MIILLFCQCLIAEATPRPTSRGAGWPSRMLTSEISIGSEYKRYKSAIVFYIIYAEGLFYTAPLRSSKRLRISATFCFVSGTRITKIIAMISPITGKVARLARIPSIVSGACTLSFQVKPTHVKIRPEK